MPDEYARARELLAGARRIFVLTGAGISAESGVPTFRGDGGLWKSFRARELATPQAFARDPALVWQWYRWRRETIGQCRPNDAHRALAARALDRADVVIVTQNVDELHADAAHEIAGERDPAAAIPIELHGSIFRTRCSSCGARRPDREVAPSASLPRCDACGGLLRPDVVWFGESLDPGVIDAAVTEAGSADVCLVIGTSAVVHPAAGLASIVAGNGGAVIEINPETTPLTATAKVSIRATAVSAVPRILTSG
jgi:NAD-dependent deacetylase